MRDDEMVVRFVDKIDGPPTAPLWVAREAANRVNDILEDHLVASIEDFDRHLVVEHPWNTWTLTVHVDIEGSHYHHAQGVHHVAWPWKRGYR